MLKGDATLPVVCAAADLHVQDGVMRPRVFVVDSAGVAACDKSAAQRWLNSSSDITM
jgi:hypothetical protein